MICWLTITETDAVGTQTNIPWNVTVETIPPVIVIGSTVMLTNDANYTLVYKIDDEAYIDSRTLVEGLNTLTITVTDLAGNVATASINVTLASVPTGTIKINNGDRYATSRSVTLKFSTLF